MAIDVTDLSDTTTREVIFTVKENTDSPYQGRLVVVPAEWAALSAVQRKALKIQQFAAWKIVRDAPKPPPPTKLEKRARLLQMKEDRQRAKQEEDQLTEETDLMPDGT